MVAITLKRLFFGIDEEPLTFKEPFIKNGYQLYTLRFFREPKTNLLWRHCEILLLEPLFLRM